MFFFIARIQVAVVLLLTLAYLDDQQQRCSDTTCSPD